MLLVEEEARTSLREQKKKGRPKATRSKTLYCPSVADITYYFHQYGCRKYGTMASLAHWTKANL
jgi:hypothetical protein